MVGWAMEKGKTYKVLSTFVLSPEPSREAYREAENISTCKAVCPTVTVLDIHRGPGPIVWYHVELQSGRGGWIASRDIALAEVREVSEEDS